jgi:hypothetical protein
MKDKAVIFGCILVIIGFWLPWVDTVSLYARLTHTANDLPSQMLISIAPICSVIILALYIILREQRPHFLENVLEGLAFVGCLLCLIPYAPILTTEKVQRLGIGFWLNALAALTFFIDFMYEIIAVAFISSKPQNP